MGCALCCLHSGSGDEGNSLSLSFPHPAPFSMHLPLFAKAEKWKHYEPFWFLNHLPELIDPTCAHLGWLKVSHVASDFAEGQRRTA